MTVFVAFAPADRAAAENLEAFVERRGQFVELDDGQTALRPVIGGDVLVLLISSALLYATARLRLEQRALDAWANGRLILVKLDHGIAPVGLRDLPAIDASFEAQREFTWAKVADAIRETLRSPSPASDGERRVRPAPARKRGDGGWRDGLLFMVLAAPGAYAFAAAISMHLVNRIGPRSGGWAELVASIDDWGRPLGLPAGFTPWLFAIAVGVTFAILFLFLAKIVAAIFSKSRAVRTERSPGVAPLQTDAMFVSYARANQGVVLPVVEAARQAGRKFWVDQQGGVSAGDGWAGEIVRAIRGATGVVVMCSKAAFESDHVKREVYLADRYKKKLTPVFIEHAEPPEDFEYFFAGVQALKLFETPEAERPQAFVRVLG